MNNLNKYSLSLIIICLPHLVFSQFNDFENWIDIGLKKELSKSLSLFFEESIRLNQNYGNLKSLNSDFGATYEINKIFEITACYRLSLKNRPGGYFFKHRGNVDLDFQKNFNHLKISYRNRTQFEKDSYVNDQNDLYISGENRNRLKFSYNLRGIKTDPYLALESFHQISPENLYRITTKRIYFGFGRKFTEDLKINLSFIYENMIKQQIENVFIIHIALKKEL